MVKLTATFIALSTATSAVLAGYSQDTCQYSHNDKGRCVYTCNENACNKSGSWIRDHFHKSMSDKGYECRFEKDSCVSCYKPHDYSDPYSHNWSCSDNNDGWDHGKDGWDHGKDGWNGKNNYDKRGYEDEHNVNYKKKHHGKHHKHHGNKHTNKKNKVHHTKRGYEGGNKNDNWDHKDHDGKNDNWDHKDHDGKNDNWDHKDHDGKNDNWDYKDHDGKNDNWDHKDHSGHYDKDNWDSKNKHHDNKY